MTGERTVSDRSRAPHSFLGLQELVWVAADGEELKGQEAARPPRPFAGLKALASGRSNTLRELDLVWTRDIACSRLSPGQGISRPEAIQGRSRQRRQRSAGLPTQIPEAPKRNRSEPCVRNQPRRRSVLCVRNQATAPNRGRRSPRP